MTDYYKRSNKLRQGFSLLEMVAAAGLMAAILVPALSVMRDAMAKSRSLHQRSLLANYAVRVLEEQCASVAGSWATGTDSGSFVSEGHATIRYDVTKSDAVVDGGLLDQLMHIQVIVYDDADADVTPDSDELQVNYRTKVAKLNTYENEE
jgi:hypothetical protein